MIAGIIAVLAFLGQIITLAMKIWETNKEKDEEKKKDQTSVIQSGVRGIIDGDATRIVAAFDRLRRLREQ